MYTWLDSTTLLGSVTIRPQGLFEETRSPLISHSVVTRKSTAITSPFASSIFARSPTWYLLGDDVEPAQQRKERLLERGRHGEADDTQREQDADPLGSDHAKRGDDRLFAMPDTEPIPSEQAEEVQRRARSTRTNTRVQGGICAQLHEALNGDPSDA